jgi:polysaccharide pyruvyl transferase WcaK-like protein
VVSGKEDEVEGTVSIANGLFRHLPDGVLAISGCLAPLDLVRLTRGTEMVVSTRYHPIVFGLSGFVPGVGLHFDEYTRVRLSEALPHGGMVPPSP